ncbi:unnamed protein product [Darwinula stevensoni]|uniref:U3 small nucleolar RNA-associated protein 11 n=1 Tax=Darwinula stevensoni TaxID=69355 RepID=A0A7R9FQH6_9CRUS|nr:unnamed protein product [Darwinula stevensoni]CAG0899463.1 unnamed protein product [Darwinula stevensoni]
MSSWKKTAASAQRIHRERHQPEARKHLGILEKKKDYTLRARDYHRKQRKLTVLKKRALERNPDEFYFHMINSKIEDGIHQEMDEVTLKPEEVSSMQTQDLKYLTMRRVEEGHKIQQLKSTLHVFETDGKPHNKHVFFVDSKQEAKDFDVSKRLGVPPELLPRSYNRPRIMDLEQLRIQGLDPRDEFSLSRVNKAVAKSFAELEKRIQREKELTVLQQKLELKRHLLESKGDKPERVKPGSSIAPPVYRWKMKRKR